MSKAVADNRDTLHLVKVNYYKQQTEMLRKKLHKLMFRKDGNYLNLDSILKNIE